MGDQPGGRLGGQLDATRADAMLRRPAVDPEVPRTDRDLLTRPGALLTPASRDRPQQRRDYLPADRGQRLATVDGAAIGLTGAMMIALFGTAPLAVGVLALQGASAWMSASSHYALLLAEAIAIVTAVVFGVRIALFGQPGGRVPAEVAARTHHGRYLTDADFDRRSRALLRRAQDAIDTVTSAQVCRDGLLDQSGTSMALAAQEWDVAVALREQSRLRARRGELSETASGPATAALLDRHAEAARLAEASITSRVEALERYAAEVRLTDAAYSDWNEATQLTELHSQHLDMLARTAADEHGIADIEAMSQQARAVRLAFTDVPGL
jgi:hypothetical protein